MKKQVIAYIASLGGSSAYARNTEKWGKIRDGLVPRCIKTTLFINDPKHQFGIQTIEECVLNKFGFNLPFKLLTNPRT